jgi:hypothetical protein
MPLSITGRKWRVYLAGRYSRRAVLCHLRDAAAPYVDCTSRWLDRELPLDPEGRSLQASDSDRAKFALEDFEDIRRADLFFALAEVPRNDDRGVRHVEFGLAYALGKPCFLLGAAENVFGYLPGVIPLKKPDDAYTIFAALSASILAIETPQEALEKRGVPAS